MKTRLWIVLILFASALGGAAPRAAAEDKPMRPPAVPLVACDPYFSIWSPADKLTDADTVHWTNSPKEPHKMRLASQLLIDHKPFRIMGTTEPNDIPALPQVGVNSLPTRTIYDFEGQGVHVTLTFMTPFLPDDLMVFSRPVTYLTWNVKATDGKKHSVEIHYCNSAEAAVSEPDQLVSSSSDTIAKLTVLKTGTVDQPVLRRKGDRTRIDWGYLVLAVPQGEQTKASFQPLTGQSQNLDLKTPVPAKDAPVMGAQFNLGQVGAEPAQRWLMLAYDDVYSLQFFYRPLKAYWKKDGAELPELLKAAAADYESLKKRCAAFDDELMADLRQAGGEKYARICALAYRQSLAASKVVADAKGQPLFFCKENTSNGCIGTVDVFYPQAPLILMISPTLSKAMLVPLLEYSCSERWKFPFAPHDVGTWPKANGQVYGGGERTETNQMPVEETGNMILLVAAVAQMDGNADFAGKYWPTLTKWADYCKSKGFDPENQLCTDDFAGHLAHNVNLSAKAICALGAYGKLCAMRGDKANAEVYGKLAKEYAARWVKEADDGDHSRLALDKPGTWSSKYNLVWDKILGLGLFPDAVLRKEMDFYRKHINKYGLPLDGRKAWSKADWALWTASLTGNRDDFDAIVSPIYDFYNETTTRVGLTDLYFTDNLEKASMHSRPVIGGLFIKMLYYPEVWKKWATRDKFQVTAWAPLPKPPKMVTVVPVASETPATWKFTTQKPGPNWNKPDFDDSAWKKGLSGFGAGNPPGSAINTRWSTPDIWIRREVTLPEGKWNDLQFFVHHDEDVQIFLNGVLATSLSEFSTSYETMPVRRQANDQLKPGKVLIAAHCTQTKGGQYIDIGLVDIQPQ